MEFNWEWNFESVLCRPTAPKPSLPVREPEGIDMARAAPDGPDRSIRKSKVSTGCGPSGLHYKMNGKGHT